MKSNIHTDPFSVENLNTLNYPTPFYLFDRNRLRDNLKQFKEYIPNVDVHYAVKANPTKDVIETLNESGAGFEIASTNELNLLMQCGVNAEKILYSAPVKPGKFIHEAYEYGVKKFAFDSKQELEKITQSAPGSSVYLRLSVTEHGSRFSLTDKFGVTLDKVVELMQYAKQLGLDPYGLTFHIGSQATSKESWKYAIRTASKAMNLLEEVGIKIQMLDLGGGFPVQYTETVPTLEEIGIAIDKAIKKYLPYRVTLVAEPGRALVATSAVLVTSIFARIKRRYMWLFVDAGSYNSLFETLESQTSMKFEIYHSLTEYNKSLNRRYTVTGPTCDSLDVLAKDVTLPSELKLGDRLYFKSAGAYSVALANSFNGFEPPAIYFVN